MRSPIFLSAPDPDGPDVSPGPGGQCAQPDEGPEPAACAGEAPPGGEAAPCLLSLPTSVSP